MSPCVIELPAGVGLVVDLDDTLYPERSFHESGFRWIAQRTGLDLDGPEVRAACRELRGSGRPLDVLSAATRVPLQDVLRWHRCHPPAIHLYPDAARFLQRAENAGVPLVLLTDGRSATQRNKIRALGISSAFQRILISEETGFTKHNRAAFAAAAEALRACTAIASFGDNPGKDLEEPLRLGWLVHLVLGRGDNVHRQDLQSRAGVEMLSCFDSVSFSA